MQNSGTLKSHYNCIFSDKQNRQFSFYYPELQLRHGKGLQLGCEETAGITDTVIINKLDQACLQATSPDPNPTLPKPMGGKVRGPQLSKVQQPTATLVVLFMNKPDLSAQIWFETVQIFLEEKNCEGEYFQYFDILPSPTQKVQCQHSEIITFEFICKALIDKKITLCSFNATHLTKSNCTKLEILYAQSYSPIKVKVERLPKWPKILIMIGQV